MRSSDESDLMIFAHTLALVLAGTKTETRRVNARAVWTLGNTYAAQPGRGKQAEGRIVATGYRTERLGDTTEASARAEGFSNLEVFKETWTRINGPWNPDQLVHVYSFERVSS